MNMLVPNFVANQKSGFEIMYSLMAKGLDSFEKLITLNSQAVNSMLVENQEAVVKALAAKDPQELFALQASQTRSATANLQKSRRRISSSLSSVHRPSSTAAQRTRRLAVKRSSQLGSPLFELLPRQRTPF